MQINDNIQYLLNKGVHIPNPAGVEIGGEVDLDNISADETVLYAGSKIFGASTLICRGARIGYEAPVTVENCQIGPDVQLKGGFFKQAVFLEKASIGLGAHIREGTILEEEANGAHTVGLKQTILFPFVTLGSLVNFCDCLMAGGTDRKNHSEVGSSYIHFNYTPNQDKATPSLIGDVPRGVMLNQRPIFLGGQGGLIGPCRLEYGITIAAGTINRKDELRPDRLIFGRAGKGGSIPYTPGVYRSNKRVIINNLNYIANLFALMQWYREVRSLFVSDQFSDLLLQGLYDKLDMAIQERIRRLEQLCLKTPPDPKDRLINEIWPALREWFDEQSDQKGDEDQRIRFLENITCLIKTHGKQYLRVIKSLSDKDRKPGVHWLQGIVDDILNGALDFFPYNR